jgi:hypothetical protein
MQFYEYSNSKFSGFCYLLQLIIKQRVKVMFIFEMGSRKESNSSVVLRMLSWSYNTINKFGSERRIIFSAEERNKTVIIVSTCFTLSAY